MADEKEKKEETSEQQQSHRRKSIEEQAEEISDVKVPPFIVILIGAIIIIALIVALIKIVPGALKSGQNQYISKDKINGQNGDKEDPKVNDRPAGKYKFVKAPENPKIKIKTNKGDMIVELYEDKAPNTVANFVELCANKFYDDIRFHRIIKNFMIQGGCPKAKGRVRPDAGSGDAGYKFADEFDKELEFNERGLLAMANSGPNTNGSQFFITDGLPNWLNGKHTIFGKVIEGMNVVEILANVKTGSQDRPLDDVYIISTEILQIRDHSYHVEKLN